MTSHTKRPVRSTLPVETTYINRVLEENLQKLVVRAVQALIAALYLIAFALFLYTQRYALSQATIAVEELIRKIMVRIADKIRRSLSLGQSLNLCQQCPCLLKPISPSTVFINCPTG